MKGFGQKSVSTRNFPKLHTLVSPEVNLLCFIEEWVAGVLSPWCFSCHPKKSWRQFLLNVKANGTNKLFLGGKVEEVLEIVEEALDEETIYFVDVIRSFALLRMTLKNSSVTGVQGGWQESCHPLWIVYLIVKCRWYECMQLREFLCRGIKKCVIKLLAEAL